MFFKLMLLRLFGVIPMLKDKEVSFWKKALLVAGIVYLFLPMDLIPPLIPVFGWLDDIVIWIALLLFLGPELEAHSTWGRKKAERAEKRRRQHGDYQEAEFTVNEDFSEESSTEDTK